MAQKEKVTSDQTPLSTAEKRRNTISKLYDYLFLMTPEERLVFDERTELNDNTLYSPIKS